MSSPDSQIFAVKVAERVDVAEDVVLLRLARADGGSISTWSPGAHIDVITPNGLTRQYSLCNERPHDLRWWEIAILREGPGSTYLHESAPAGTVLQVRGPRNHFPLLRSPRYLFIAGGIGITPIRAMINQLIASGDGDWSLVYGGRSRSSMAFHDELVKLDPDRVDVWPLDERGLIDLDVIDRTEPDTLIYCCGPESLLLAVEARCAVRGPGSLRVERFRPKDVGDEPGTRFDVVVSSTGAVVPVPPDVSILATLRAAGYDLPSSCEEGVCGTCETRVLDGEVDHRDSVLTPGERAANDTMMICCSRALSPRLVLDL